MYFCETSRRKQYKLRFTAHQPPSPAPVCVRNISDLPTKDIGWMIVLGIPTKARSSHENEHPLFVYYRVSNVERYTLASIPNTRGS